MKKRVAAIFLASTLSFLATTNAQSPVKSAPPAAKASPTHKPAPHPKLVVVIVVDQMRADYVDKFRDQWTSGLKRLVEQGAWFREAAYPYAAMETCVGHATISTGALPATSGIIRMPGGIVVRRKWLRVR